MAKTLMMVINAGLDLCSLCWGQQRAGLGGLVALPMPLECKTIVATLLIDFCS